MLGFFLGLLLSAPADLRTPPRDNTRVLKAGLGTKHPTDDDVVMLRYVVWHDDGTLADQVVAPQWIMVDMKEMTAGWHADVLKMTIGEERRTWMPAENTVIDTELMQIIPRPEAPSDVAAVPADAIRTPSGLAYKVLRPGAGTIHPKHGDRVLVSYSGWTTDGKLFDSSNFRSGAEELPADGGIKGWSEAVQSMTSGGKSRFWLPPNLAYEGMPEKPQGMIVFDIELHSISSEIGPKRSQRKFTPQPLPPGVH